VSTKSCIIESYAESTPTPVNGPLDRWAASGSYTKISAISPIGPTSQTIQSKVNNDHQTFNFEKIAFQSGTVINKIELVATAMKVGTQTTKMSLTFAKGSTLSDLPAGGIPIASTTVFDPYTRDVTKDPVTGTSLSLNQIKYMTVEGTAAGTPITFGVAQNTDGKTILVNAVFLRYNFKDEIKPTTTETHSGTVGNNGWYKFLFL
jgi:hypothetical protein